MCWGRTRTMRLRRRAGLAVLMTATLPVDANLDDTLLLPVINGRQGRSRSTRNGVASWAF
jgi:hypothetical protein